MGYEVQGRIHTIAETVQVTEKFRKRAFVLEIEPDGRYPQFCEFEFSQDRCELLDLVEEGQDATVEFSLRGREWTNNEGQVKTFNTLAAWKVDVQGAQAPAPSDEEEGGGL